MGVHWKDLPHSLLGPPLFLYVTGCGSRTGLPLAVTSGAIPDGGESERGAEAGDLNLVEGGGPNLLTEGGEPDLVARHTIAVGAASVCAIKDGGVECWGDNSGGELGNGSTVDSNVPVPVRGLFGVVEISAGSGENCALTAEGTVACWGEGGELGFTGAGFFSLVPVQVANVGPGAAAISVGTGNGANYACAITARGDVMCWGSNDSGQLGDGSTRDSNVPVAVIGLDPGATALAAGGAHTCVVTSGGVQCWGANDFGQLGTASPIQSLVPIHVSGVGSAFSVAAGFTATCSVGQEGALMCWGGSPMNQDCGPPQSANPAPITGLGSGVTSVALQKGSCQFCIVTIDGEVMCWGNGEYAHGPLPQPVHGLGARAVEVSNGAGTACARTAAGHLMCWGYGADGELGNGLRTPYSAVPVRVSGF